MPDPELVRAAERGLVVLSGCVVVEGQAEFRCRACAHEWGSPDDPTTDEQELADLVGVQYEDVVRAVGTGWRRADEAHSGLTWFVSGRPAQVALGVGGGMVVLGAVPAGGLLDAEDAGRVFSRDDLLCAPEWLAQAADEIARARRRSFRWCPVCREPHPPEEFAGYRGVCVDCAERHHGLGR
ncbi:hypothetical protein O2W14_18155 [Modestobacter sp. VKM Ac-2986]|uniref:hypothetical protein n=1 Tax=Modestobacter sp. VKM Ac-2986 TaxID=3004140 RepID=UPI0022AB93BC|nr:hypothetical protein [Modestobacter sp. VKM Ac-2986]MCZ2830767.1 hypothetical protein [Modestobacter sp. VKM Ac-2986]